jgi:CDP-glucose 4,6-dehydratase
MKIKKIFNNTFENKVVFLTGHTGFQGSWLTLWLKLLGAKIIGFSQEPPTNPSMFKILEL